MKRECDICGCVQDDYWMMNFNPGTGLKWLCWDCYKQSQYEVIKSEVLRQKRFAKQNVTKKRSR